MQSHEGTGGLGDKSSQLASTAREKAGGVASTAGEQARSLAGEARSEAQNVASDVQARLREEAGEQTRRTSQNLRQWSEELSSMADNGDSGSPVRDAVNQVAQSGLRAADFLEERGFEGLVDEAKQFARRKPMAFLAGAAVAGFALGRVLKVSSALSDDSGTDSGHPRQIGSGGHAAPSVPHQSRDDSGGTTPYLQQPGTPRHEGSGTTPGDPGMPGRTL
ncbi:hypothetical protein [Nocardiopsis algeriensis]|uniref:Vacuolar-type H+-ATPase subunit H n=1 Tax=Nocardiopsis algeriensis TaxID=1478215 RepID=A0A841IQJ6_9ACTN|nr:hypothetical protein [Nocardiopsis algeriensis]MBB6121119.1 vacuolar-type H+-ATPase subunit H [Nocardiopsis algeriensis]